MAELIAMFTSMRAQMQTLSRMMSMSGGMNGALASRVFIRQRLSHLALALLAAGLPGRQRHDLRLTPSPPFLHCPSLCACLQWRACPR